MGLYWSYWGAIMLSALLIDVIRRRRREKRAARAGYRSCLALYARWRNNPEDAGYLTDSQIDAALRQARLKKEK